jgi:membrane protein YdbS with pleckstrin-like domain
MTSTAPPQTDYDHALTLFRDGRYDEALPVLQRHAAVSPDEATLYGIAICHLRLGDWVAGEQALREVVRRFPDRVEYAAELRAAQSHLAAQDDLSEPSRLGTDTRDLSTATLAGVMEEGGESPGLGDYAGEFLLRRRRRLLSHRRLWLAMVMVVVDLFLIGWLETRVQGSSAAVSTVLGAAPLLVVSAALVLVAGALLSSRMTSYCVWTHRLDITTGVLWRRHRVVWFYKVTDIHLVQDPVLLLAGTASLVLFLDDVRPSTRRPPRVVAAGSTEAMRRLQDQLLLLVAQERRDMKKQFI